MNETQWLTCQDPVVLLDYLEGKASERKLRLFACACVRRCWRCFRNVRGMRDAIETAERVADGEVVNLEELRTQAEMIAGDAPWFEAPAYQAAAATLLDSAAEAARSAREYIRQQAVREAANEVVSWMDEARVNREASDAENAGQCELIREVFGNPFRPTIIQTHWLQFANGTPAAMARQFYDERQFDHLPYLSDALTDGDCTDEVLLAHLRAECGHVRGCWALDALLAQK